MESGEGRSNRGEEGEGDGGGGAQPLLSKPVPSRPILSIPPRNFSEAFQTSADVTTFIPSFFAEQEPDLKGETYSQMLAGAMSPPVSHSTGTASENVSSASLDVVEEKPGAGVLSGLPGTSGPKGPAGSASTGPGRPNVARFKLMMPSRLPIPRSPYLTIPPGLSPTTLLESPVLLSTGQAEPSPTTGTFPLPPISQGSATTAVSVLDSSQDKSQDQDGSSAFVFKPVPKIGRSPPSPLAKMQSASQSPQMQAQGQILSLTSAAIHVASAPQTGTASSFWDVPKLAIPLQSKGPTENTNEVVENTESVAQPPVSSHPPVIERPSEDGYNWRKYGQKQVKGSEFPRSYYKCTHPNCPVKKKVERSHDGQVTEIVYKGEHNHPKPQSTRRMSMGAAHAANGSNREGSKVDGSFESSSDARGQLVSISSGATQTPEPSSGSTSDDEGNAEGSKAEDGDDLDPESKRRKRERVADAAAIPPLRTIREPRVVVQTTSEVDILDDGYRWRKYGQKVVKGNPYPRSYYKCTNLGCSVRKHVERSSADPRAVITTYEGKHNHDVPVARNSNHDSGGSNATTNSLPPHNTNLVNRPPSAVQDQISMGKLLDDRLKADERSIGLDPGAAQLRHTSASSVQAVQASKSQGERLVPASILVPASVSFISGGMNVLPGLQGPESFGQTLILRPKEEQDEGNVNPPSWPSAFLNSSVTRGMMHRLTEGP